MPTSFSKYVPHVVECMASSYIDYNPIPLIKVRSCFAAHGWGGVNEVYSGLKYAVKLGYIEEVPYGRLVRYRPTLTGVVKGGVMDVVVDELGIMDASAIDVTERLSIILYSILLTEIPNAIQTAQHGADTVECVCCAGGGSCYSYRYRGVGGRVYLGMITLKVLAGIEVRGVRPRDYWQLFRFTRGEVSFYLAHGLGGVYPEVAVKAFPLVRLFLGRLDRGWFTPRVRVELGSRRLNPLGFRGFLKPS
jgi:hypothetical protein